MVGLPVCFDVYSMSLRYVYAMTYLSIYSVVGVHKRFEVDHSYFFLSSTIVSSLFFQDASRILIWEEKDSRRNAQTESTSFESSNEVRRCPPSCCVFLLYFTL